MFIDVHMRQLRTALAALLLAACGGEAPAPQAPSGRPAPTGVAPSPPADEKKPPAPTPKMTTADAAKVTLPAYVESLNQHDAKRFAGFFTEDAALIAPGFPAAKGRAAIAQGIQRGFDVFSSLKLASSRVLVKGDVVVHEWAMIGVHSGDFHGVKPTEKPVGLTGVSLLVFDPESGLIKEERRYADTPTLLSQIGASKAKARPIPILSSSPEWRTARGSPEEDKNADAYKRMIATVGEKNEAGYLALQTDDVAYDDMTQPVTLRGQSEAKKWFKGFVATFPDVKGDVAGAWAVDDYVVAEITVTGTHKATKKSVTVHGVDVAQMKDGKVAHGWSYADGSELAAQLAPPLPAKTEEAKKK